MTDLIKQFTAFGYSVTFSRHDGIHYMQVVRAIGAGDNRTIEYTKLEVGDLVCRGASFDVLERELEKLSDKLIGI